MHLVVWMPSLNILKFCIKTFTDLIEVRWEISRVSLLQPNFSMTNTLNRATDLSQLKRNFLTTSIFFRRPHLYYSVTRALAN